MPNDIHAVHLPLALTSDPGWTLVEEGFTLTREHEVESLFALGNGYLGSRASLAEGSSLSAPATVVAGVYDVEAGSVPGLIVVEDWSQLSLTIGGERLRLDRGQNLEHRRILDMRQGILWREWRHQDGAGRITRFRSLRMSSLANRHLLIRCATLTPENYSGRVLIDAAMTGSAALITSRGTKVALAVADRVLDPDGRVLGSTELMDGQQSLDVELGKTYRLDRVAAVHTSRDTPESDEAARSHAARAVEYVSGEVDQHRAAWLARWNASDVQIEGDPVAQRALRFAAYHLLSSANPQDERVSVGAKGLSGPGYKGHVFWDTEIFMLPFYLLTYPEAARALLMYRFHTLAAARADAARRGYRGALYAWESADTGEDMTPPFAIAPDGEVVRILTGEQEQHISADVAYAVWNYWRATDDDRFLVDAGAEILVETARFWASRSTLEDDKRYHIRGVIGPDEYHEAVDDNAYTNGLAQWNLDAAAEVAEIFSERWPVQWQALSRRLGLADEEWRTWQQVARDLYTGFNERTGLFEQFHGYFDLEDIDLATYSTRTAPMDLLLGRERIAQSQVIKQPDVVMLVHLLWDRLPADVRKINFDYYEPRCGHGSSLSPAIHALVAARLGDTELAERYFHQSAEIDLANNMGNAANGVHVGALGGLWQATVFGFAGLRLITEDGPECDPMLPSSWRSLSMRLQWRGLWHEFNLSGRGAADNSKGDP
ncbi:MAG: glycoside hydrolase family 65 protein [Hyphomicrobiaceae bacterium]|nr:glycoside hydrolase family 65 protein [Hyphomicrobiaceae bacterium]